MLLVDKPKGITSFDVIRKLRKELGIHKMGHAGTLDPLATGLLIIGIGDDTKKLTELIGLPKTYEAEIALGKSTDTGDVDGTVTGEMCVSELSQEQVSTVIKSMKGEHTLPVSLFSAIKREGKRLYEYAHKGEVVEKPVRLMKVLDTHFISYSEEDKTIRVIFDVSSGTYIRSLAEEVGKRLGTLAHIRNLRRLSIGSYNVKDARTL